jgi:Holliday junction resolvase RusA-like endonuclease
MTISFTLPRILPLLNVQLRQHWAKRQRNQKKLAWEVKAAIGTLPWAPFARARVTVERCSVGVPDTDNLVASCKALMDVLCVYSKRHPFGLGIIADDSPGVCELIVRAVKVARRKEQRTTVTVEALA